MGERTILLVPAPGDPHGLLADEVGGGRVPVMHRVRGFGANPGPRWLEGRKSASILANPEALLLALDGVPVPMGLDRANRVLIRVTEGAVGAVLNHYDRAYVDRRARLLARHIPGSRLVVLVDGVEVPDAP